MDDRKRQDFEQLVEEVIDCYQAVGLGIAIIDTEKTLYQKFWGYRDLAANLPVDEDTLFGLASITKSFTCLAIAQLQEEGKLSATDPVSMYIPEFQYPGEGVLTIEHLMAHNGGYEPQPALGWSIHQHTQRDPLSEEAEAKEEEWRKRYPPKRMDSFSDMIAHLSDPQQRLLGQPGQFFSYSNDTYGVLGEIIKRVSGAASYEQYMEEHILKPLGMQRSCFEAEKLSDDGNVNTLYRIEKQERIATNHWQAAPAFTPCGFLKSTLRDMKRYLSMYLNQGRAEEKSVLSPFGIAEMIKPIQPCQHQRYYGYGLNVQSVGDIRIVEHGGSLNGVSTHLAWSPELGKGVVVLCNTSGVAVQLLATAALMWCNDQPVRQPRIPYRQATWSAALKQAVVGDYLSGEGSRCRIRLGEDDLLVLELDGAPEQYAIEAVLPHLAVVRIKMGEVELRPLLREDGQVWAIFYGSRVIPRA